ERAGSAYAGGLDHSCSSLPFGDGFSCNAGDPSILHFTGQEHDFESSLDYFNARHYSSNQGRFMSRDWSDDPYEPVPYADPADPQSLNQYAFARNNPVTNVDRDGHDCISVTADADGNATAIIVRGDDCQGMGLGDYFDGTIDVNSLTFNSGTGEVDFGFDFQGGVGTGSLTIPTFDQDQLQGFVNQVAAGSAGAEVLGPALLDAASLPFPFLATLAGAAADLGPGPSQAVIPRIGTGPPGSNQRLNRMVEDAAKQVGLNPIQRDKLHDELHAMQDIEEHRFSFQEIKQLALAILRGAH